MNPNFSTGSVRYDNTSMIIDSSVNTSTVYICGGKNSIL